MRISVERAAWRHLIRATTLTGAVTLGIAGCAAERKTVPASAVAAPATVSPDAAKSVEWKTDAQGRQYRVDPYPKSRPHQRLSPDRIRTVWGFEVELDGETDTDFLVKIYRTEPVAPDPEAVRARHQLTPEEKAAIVARNTVRPNESHALEFTPIGGGLPSSGQWREGFALADMNGDGNLDLVHGPARKQPGPPLIFLGDGHGGFQRWADARFPAQPYDYGDVVVADFTGDGAPDLALGMHLLGITALRGNAGDVGGFTPLATGMDATTDKSKPAFSSKALAATDWDGDGRVDVIAVGEGPRLSGLTPGAKPVSASNGVVLYRNRGDGSWEKRTAPVRGPSFGDDIALGTFTNGTRGFVTGTSVRGEKAILYLADGDPWRTVPIDALRPGSYVRSVAVADFDLDGRDDLAVGFAAFDDGVWMSGVDLLFQDSSGGFTRQTLLAEEGSFAVTGLGAGPIDRDPAPDLVALTGDGRTLVFRNDGHGRLAMEGSSLTPASADCRGSHAEIRDLDRDGTGEVIVEFAGEAGGFGGVTSPGCPGEGSIRAWRATGAGS